MASRITDNKRVLVNVVPCSKKQEITKLEGNHYRVKLKSPARNNKANTELIKLLEKHFNKDARILKGKASKKKIVLLE